MLKNPQKSHEKPILNPKHSPNIPWSSCDPWYSSRLHTCSLDFVTHHSTSRKPSKQKNNSFFPPSGRDSLRQTLDQRPSKISRLTGMKNLDGRNWWFFRFQLLEGFFLYGKSIIFTLPETNSLYLKMDGWNISFLLEWPIFRCYVSLGSVFPFKWWRHFGAR